MSTMDGNALRQAFELEMDSKDIHALRCHGVDPITQNYELCASGEYTRWLEDGYSALLTENAELKKKVESRENTIAEIREEVFPPEPDEIVDNYFAVKNIQDILTHMKE